MKWTYLLVNIFTILIPFIFSFHPKLLFYKTWKSFFPAVCITGILFIIWDSLFTHLGVWGFNGQYISGLKVGNLPLEEILFFFCIPYACVFTFHCINILWTRTLSEHWQDRITALLIIVLAVTGIANFSKLYTASTFISLAVVLSIARYFLHIKWLGKFYVIYALLLLPFLVVNGILTGTGLEEPVVWYNNAENLGVRIGTIPVEDVFYGMELILINVVLYKRIK